MSVLQFSVFSKLCPLYFQVDCDVFHRLRASFSGRKNDAYLLYKPDDRPFLEINLRESVNHPPNTESPAHKMQRR